MQVDVTVTGDRQAAALVDRLSRRLADGAPALRGLVDVLLEAQAERFAGRGQRWKQLSPQTQRIDREQGRDPRTLVLTGALMHSLTRRGAAGQIVQLTPTSLRFGTRVFYARFHQRGEGVTKRTVVGLTRIQKQSVTAELRRLLVEDL